MILIKQLFVKKKENLMCNTEDYSEKQVLEKEKIWTKFIRFYARIKPYLNQWIWVLPPIIVAFAMLAFFENNGLYPFSDKSISWGDMDQQYIPLLLTFKDVLSGKEGFFYNTSHAAGMNFYGVFFYFLSSPFTFLVVFVDKADMASFVNILVLLKMCVIAGTASFYLSRKYPSAPLLNVFLSVLYAFPRKLRNFFRRCFSIELFARISPYLFLMEKDIFIIPFFSVEVN